jgi:ABC-2 type transport system ATP-binding protein
VLRIEGLTKRFGAHLAVDGLDLHADAGEVVALLGPNGAGKTTTFRCLTGIAQASAGRITVAGHDTRSAAAAAKRALGFIPDRAWFYPKATGREVLRFVARARDVPDADAAIRALLARFTLDDAADARSETYSHGMRQRLAFCVALLGDPPLLVVDEPMVGLDARGHRDVKVLFREIAAAGRTVLLSTHTLSVAEEIADRIVLIDRGRKVAEGDLATLRAATEMASATLEELFLRLTGDGA